jgi:hypothetical protein
MHTVQVTAAQLERYAARRQQRRSAVQADAGWAVLSEAAPPAPEMALDPSQRACCEVMLFQALDRSWRTRVHEEILAAIPQDQPGSRLEVVLIHEDPEHTRLELRHLLWGDGIGWYRLHTLQLGAPAVRALGRLLSQAQQRLDHRMTPGPGNTVIPFPRLGQTCQRAP